MKTLDIGSTLSQVELITVANFLDNVNNDQCKQVKQKLSEALSEKEKQKK